MPIPKRIRSTRSSRGVRLARTRVTVSLRLAWIAASTGITAFLSSMKSPRWLSSSSPVGDRAGDRLTNPPGRVGRELVAAAIFELIDRLHQADVAFLDEVQELQTAI